MSLRRARLSVYHLYRWSHDAHETRPAPLADPPTALRALRRLPRVSTASADFGEFFEHYVFLELRAWIDYRRLRTPLAYWRSRSGHEVDFILDEHSACWPCSPWARS